MDRYNPTYLSAMSVGSGGRIDIAAYIPTGKKAKDYFEPGDEVWVDIISGTDARYWVVKVINNGAVQAIDLIDKDGLFITTGSNVIESIRVIRSGKRNMQSVKVGSLVFKTTNLKAFNPADPSTEKASSASFTRSNILDAGALEFSDVWQTLCGDCPGMGTWMGSTAKVNPYRLGLKGIWRPWKSFAYVTDRTQASNIKTDGLFTAYNRFKWEAPLTSDAKWVNSNKVTKYSPFGYELENKDAVGVYSAALYEYNHSAITALAHNAMHKEIAYDGFEDYYGGAEICTDPKGDHWGFNANYQQVSSSYAHTGKYSFSVAQGISYSLTKVLVNKDCETTLDNIRHATPDTLSASAERTTDTCDCIGVFSPVPGKKYQISGWVKQLSGLSSPVNTFTTFTSPKINVDILDGNGNPIAGFSYSFSPSATEKIIEGWQRITGTFELPTAAKQIKVTLVNSTGGSATVDYFDDIRIYPFDGNMITYVYDPASLRLLAELDANNYATFYVYDDEGKLTKVKKETITGIKTIKEGRMNYVPH